AVGHPPAPDCSRVRHGTSAPRQLEALSRVRPFEGGSRQARRRRVVSSERGAVACARAEPPGGGKLLCLEKFPEEMRAVTHSEPRGRSRPPSPLRGGRRSPRFEVV